MQIKEAEAKANIGKGTKWINDVKQAGATTIYLVMGSASMQRHGPTIIIPVPDAKAAAVAKLVPIPQPARPAGTQPAARPRPGEPQVATIPGVGVVFGATANMNAFKALKPAPRADLAAAFKTAGAAPIKLAVGIDARTRQEMAKNFPPMILGKPSTLITKDFQWLSAAATPPPNMTVKAIVQSTDAASAKGTDELIVSAIVMNQQSPNKLPDQLITLLTPHVEGRQLVLALDAKQINELAVAMREPLARGRQAALRVKSASNIRQLIQTCLLYSNDNRGKYPPNLQELEKAMVQWMPEPKQVKDILTNPARPDVKPAYVYIPPAKGNAAPPETVVIYESHKDFGDGINVGFADGHVEFVNQKQQFEQMLARTAQQE
jgi:prepilin-type processing-associated H-X9-DG protein